MLKMTIQNPEIDEKTTKLTTKTFEMITPHWQKILPPITIIIASKRFNYVPELKKLCKTHNKQLSLEKSMWGVIQVICPEVDTKKTTLWVRYNHKSIMGNPDYYFQKELFAVIAEILWMTSARVREMAFAYATGMATHSDSLTYMAFRDSFSRYFLNPKYLQERKETAWAFMQQIDQALQV